MRSIKFRSWNGKNFEYFNNGKCDCAFGWGEAQQFTGLVDKQGVEIYEGDIVRATFGKHSKLNEYGEWTGKIFFNCGSFDIDGEWCVALNALGDTTFEVIGNIYQNAELLE